MIPFFFGGLVVAQMINDTWKDVSLKCCCSSYSCSTAGSTHYNILLNRTKFILLVLFRNDNKINFIMLLIFLRFWFFYSGFFHSIFLYEMLLIVIGPSNAFLLWEYFVVCHNHIRLHHFSCSFFIYSGVFFFRVHILRF